MDATTAITSFPSTLLSIGQPQLAREDRVSNIAADILLLVVQFCSKQDQFHLSLVSRKWLIIIRREGDPNKLRQAIADMPQKIFYVYDQATHKKTRTLIKSDSFFSSTIISSTINSRFIYTDTNSLALSTEMGVFTTTDRTHWKRLTTERVKPQKDKRDGVISYTIADRTNPYISRFDLVSVKLDENRYVETNYAGRIEDQGFRRLRIHTDTNMGQANSEFSIHVKPYIPTRNSPDPYQIARTSLYDKWLSVVFEDWISRDEVPSQLRIYDITTKKPVCRFEGGRFKLLGEYIIRKTNSPKERVSVYRLTSSPRPQLCWSKRTSATIKTYNSCWLILSSIRKNWENEQGNRLQHEFSVVNMYNGKVQLIWKDSVPSVLHDVRSVLHKNILFFQNADKISIIHIPTATAVVQNKTIPRMSLLLDAKAFGNEILIYFATSECMLRILRFGGSDRKREPIRNMESLEQETKLEAGLGTRRPTFMLGCVEARDPELAAELSNPMVIRTELPSVAEQPPRPPDNTVPPPVLPHIEDNNGFWFSFAECFGFVNRIWNWFCNLFTGR